MRVLERFTERLIDRQRRDVREPTSRSSRSGGRRCATCDADRDYQKIWYELQALAWSRPELRERVAHVDAEWRAVLTEAFAEPLRALRPARSRWRRSSRWWRRFNEGLILERLSGIETGHAELLDWIDAWLAEKEARR